MIQRGNLSDELNEYYCMHNVFVKIKLHVIEANFILKGIELGYFLRRYKAIWD